MQPLHNPSPLVDKAAVKRRIERLDAPADIKVLLEKLLDATLIVGDKIIQVGSKILEVVFDFAKAYPSIALGVAAALVISWLVHAIPGLGPLLSPILTPILLILGIGLGTLNEMMDVSMKVKMAGVEAQFRTFGMR